MAPIHAGRTTIIASGGTRIIASEAFGRDGAPRWARRRGFVIVHCLVFLKT